MVSELAIAEIEELAGDGVALSPREIIRLNAYGLKVERNEDAAEAFALPRVAFLGDHALREPTIGHEIWLAEAAAFCNFADAPTELAVHAAALMAPDADKLPKLSGWFVRARLYAFVSKAMRRLRKFTATQIRVAVDFAEFGADETIGEKPPRMPQEREEDDRNANLSVAVGVLLDGVVSGLGVSVADLRKLGAAKVAKMAERAYQLKGADMAKVSKSRASGEFYAVLEEIKAAHAKEARGNGDE